MMESFPSRICARAKGALLRLTCPQQVRTNQDTGLIRLIACLCMFIDHAGKMLFPQLTVMREIGRLAFPLFSYGIAVGAVCTRHPERYLSRVVGLAIVCQPLYAVALAHENAAMYAVSFARHLLKAALTFYLNSWQKPSILLSLSLGLLLLLCLRGRKWVLALGVYLLCNRMNAQLDYGVHGIHLMLLFYLLCEYPAACFAATFSFMTWWSLQGTGYSFFGHSFGMRVFSLPAVALCSLPVKRHVQLPRWFIYGFYPAHLVALIVLCRVF